MSEWSKRYEFWLNTHEGHWPFDFCIARDGSNFYLCCARPTGLLDTRVLTILNHCSESNEATSRARISPQRQGALFWLDPEWDRDQPKHTTCMYGKALLKLVGFEKEGRFDKQPRPIRAVLKPTGRTQVMQGEAGGYIQAQEVEVLLDEAQISHRCYYCDVFDVDRAGNWARISGSGPSSLYCCYSVSRVAHFLAPANLVSFGNVEQLLNVSAGLLQQHAQKGTVTLQADRRSVVRVLGQHKTRYGFS